MADLIVSNIDNAPQRKFDSNEWSYFGLTYELILDLADFFEHPSDFLTYLMEHNPLNTFVFNLETKQISATSTFSLLGNEFCISTVDAQGNRLNEIFDLCKSSKRLELEFKNRQERLHLLKENSARNKVYRKSP